MNGFTQRAKRTAGDPRSLAVFIFIAALSLTLALAQFHDHRPPWDAPVASTRTIRSGGASIQIDFGSGSVNLPEASIVHWISNAALAVTTYYGRFPVPRDRILVQFVPGDGLHQRQHVLGVQAGELDSLHALLAVQIGQQRRQRMPA